IVRDHAQAHPTLHPGIPAIATTIQSVASFEHANATFHSRSPLMAASEGALLLMSSSFGALCGAVRNRNLLHTHLAQFCLVARGVEPCVTSHQLRNTPELLFVFLHRRHQEVGIIGPLGEHLVMGDDLILRFLNLDHLPELGRLARFPLADHFRARFKYTHQFPRYMDVSTQHASSALPDHLSHARQHGFQIFPQPLQNQFLLVVFSAFQTAVRGVVNVSFHHRRIHPQPLPSRNLFLLGYGHQSLMNLLDHIWAEGLQQPSQGLRIRNFLCSDPRKLPVDDIGPHLTLGLLKAPVPHVLQYRQPQRNLGGRLLPPTATALRPSSPLGFVNGVQQLLVVQHLVGLLHPLFPPPRRFFGKPSLPHRPLVESQFNHRRASVWPSAFCPSSCDATARGSLRPSHRPAPKILSTPRALGARPRRAWPAHTTRGSSLRSDR